MAIFLVGKEKLKSALMLLLDKSETSFTVELGMAESRALKDLEEWELREDIFWKHKARVDWL